MKKLFLIDAYALIFKYYYAFMRRPMRNRAGMNTSIAFGFTKFLFDIQRREHPDLLGVAFDHKDGSFRRRLYPDYKGNRPPTPEDIIATTPYVKRIISAMRIPIFEIPDFEADDTIGTLAFRGAELGYDVYMVTPDKDYGQLVGPHRSIYKQHGDDIEIVDAQGICSRYGIKDPVLVRDILALWGDASDNIPGVPHVGEKTACALVGEWGDVEEIISHADLIKGSTGENIRQSIDQLRLSRTLATIRTDVPVELDEKELSVCPPDREALSELFRELEFKAFMPYLEEGKVAAAESTATQADLFGETPVSPAVAPRRNAVDEGPTLFGSVESVHCNDTEKYTMVDSVSVARKAADVAGKEGVIAFSVETTGLDPFSDRIVGISFHIGGEGWYFPSLSLDEKLRNGILQEFGRIFASSAVEKAGHNLKFAVQFLRASGVEMKGRLRDTMLMHYILDPESRHTLPEISLGYLGVMPQDVESLIGRGSHQLSLEQVQVEGVASYSVSKSRIVSELYVRLWNEIEKGGYTALYDDIEEPLIGVLADMEWEGVTIDTAALGRYSVELQTRLRELERSIRLIASEPELNVNSSRQLGEVLFGKMHIAEKPKMTKTRQYCTDEEYLQGFAAEHEIVGLVLEYRGVKKLLSTYVEALPQLINPRTGRIHTSYNQAVTVTGRLSSTNPNLQNIPVRDEMGRPIRAAFVPSAPDRLIMSADYSQVELRIMAHLSGDDGLVSAFESGQDVHAATAARIFHKSIGEVTSDERRMAKTANFGIIYGISAFGLSQRLGIPRSEAKQLIDGYFASYPKVGEYIRRVIEDAGRNGYVSTLFGRRRYLPDIRSSNANVRGFAERNAVNAPIQGTAADIMKKAMAAIHRRFVAEGIRSRIIMQVHDEVVIDLVGSEEEKVRGILTAEMENAARLKVRLVAECGVGGNWLEAH